MQLLWEIIGLLSSCILIVAVCVALYLKHCAKKRRRLAWKLKKHRKRRQEAMNELLQQYVGQEFILYTMDAQVTGTIESVDGNWVAVKTKTNTDLLNTDYIIRIRSTGRQVAEKKEPPFPIAD